MGDDVKSLMQERVAALPDELKITAKDLKIAIEARDLAAIRLAKTSLELYIELLNRFELIV